VSRSLSRRLCGASGGEVIVEWESGDGMDGGKWPCKDMSHARRVAALIYAEGIGAKVRAILDDGEEVPLKDVHARALVCQLSLIDVTGEQ